MVLCSNSGMQVDNRRRAFRKRIGEEHIIVAPGVYDAFTAKLATHVGFEALYVTGAESPQACWAFRTSGL